MNEVEAFGEVRSLAGQQNMLAIMRVLAKTDHVTRSKLCQYLVGQRIVRRSPIMAGGLASCPEVRVCDAWWFEYMFLLERALSLHSQYSMVKDWGAKVKESTVSYYIRASSNSPVTMFNGRLVTRESPRFQRVLSTAFSGPARFKDVSLGGKCFMEVVDGEIFSKVEVEVPNGELSILSLIRYDQWLLPDFIDVTKSGHELTAHLEQAAQLPVPAP